MSQSPPNEPRPISELLSVEDILGSAPTLEQITKQMNNPKARLKTKAKPKLKRDFTPAYAQPPRGPDQQISKRELSYIDHLKREITYFKLKANRATYLDNFLTRLLEAE